MSLEEQIQRLREKGPELAPQALDNGSQALVRKLCEKVMQSRRIRLSQLAAETQLDRQLLSRYFYRDSLPPEEQDAIGGRIRRWLLWAFVSAGQIPEQYQIREQQSADCCPSLQSPLEALVARHQLRQITVGLAKTKLKLSLQTRVAINLASGEAAHAVPQCSFSHFYVLDSRPRLPRPRPPRPSGMLVPLPIRLQWLGRSLEDVLHWDMSRPPAEFPSGLRQFIKDLLSTKMLPLPLSFLESLFEEALQALQLQLQFKTCLYDWRRVLMRVSFLQGGAVEGVVQATLQAEEGQCKYRESVLFNILQEQVSVQQFVEQICEEEGLAESAGVLAGQLRTAIFDDLQRRYICLLKLQEALVYQKEKVTSQTRKLRKAMFYGCEVELPRFPDAPLEAAGVSWGLSQLLEQFSAILPARVRESLPPAPRLGLGEAKALLAARGGVAEQVKGYLPAQIQQWVLKNLQTFLLD